MANLRDRCDRAIIAFIKDAAQSVDAAIQLYPCNYSGERSAVVDGVNHGLVDVVTSQGAEEPPFSGNHWMDVKVRVEYPAANQANQSDKFTNRVLLGKIVDAVYDCLHQSDNGCDYKATAVGITTAGNALAVDASGGTDPIETERAADDADMADFTCLFMRGVSYLGAPDEGGNSASFVEIMRFQIYAAAQGGLN